MYVLYILSCLNSMEIALISSLLLLHWYTCHTYYLTCMNGVWWIGETTDERAVSISLTTLIVFFFPLQIGDIRISYNIHTYHYLQTSRWGVVIRQDNQPDSTTRRDPKNSLDEPRNAKPHDDGSDETELR